MIVLFFLDFWRASLLFSLVIIPIYIPTNGIQEFPFLHILANTYLLDNNHSNRCEVICHGFDFHFPDNLWFWAPFHLPVGHLNPFLEKIVQVVFNF